MTVKSNTTFLLFFFTLCSIFFSINSKVLSVEAETTAFTVTPEYPENQVSEATYFDLYLQENKQTLTILVTNTSEQTLQVKAGALNSYTTSTGIIAYQSRETAEMYQGQSFTQFVEPKQQIISLQPSESKKVSFQLDSQRQKITGEVLGAFAFETITFPNQEKAMHSMIQAKYLTQIGVRLRTDLGSLPEPNLLFDKTEPVIKNDTVVIKSTLINNQPTALGKVNVETTVYDKTNKKIIGAKKADNYQIAPNSLIPILTELKEETLKSGTYNVHIAIHSSKGNWVFDDSFTISAAQAKAINQKTVFFTKQKDESIIFSILVGMLIVFLLAILGLLWKYYQLKNKKRVNQE